MRTGDSHGRDNLQFLKYIAVQAHRRANGLVRKQPCAIFLVYHCQKIERGRIQQDAQRIALAYPAPLIVLDAGRTPDSVHPRDKCKFALALFEFFKLLLQYRKPLFERVHVLGGLVQCTVIHLPRFLYFGALGLGGILDFKILQEHERVALPYRTVAFAV